MGHVQVLYGPPADVGDNLCVLRSTADLRNMCTLKGLWEAFGKMGEENFPLLCESNVDLTMSLSAEAVDIEFWEPCLT
jgi:hypothetical protein